jgi:hypothetical protein
MLWSKNTYNNVLIPYVLYESDGTVKTNIVTATIRVYQIQSYVENEILAETPMTEVGELWVYDWVPSSALDVGTYIVASVFTDSLAEVRKIYDILYVTEDSYLLVNGTPFDPGGMIP